MKIQEAAEQLGMTTRAIRFYEQKGLLPPLTKEQNGYRIFNETDMNRLRTIGALREMNLSIEQIRCCIDDAILGNMESVRPFLLEKRQELALQYTELKRLINQIDKLLNYENENSNQGEMMMGRLHAIGEQSRQYQKLRSDWSDRWNFDKQATHYDKLVANGTGPLDVHANYEDILDRVCLEAKPKPGAQGLEIGVGTGNLAGRCVNQGAEMTGIDQSSAMLERCREKWPNIRLLQGNMLALPLADEAFDFIVSTYALHHVTDEQKEIVLAEMCRVLQPSGRIVIADLMFRDDAHRASFIEDLKEAEDFEGIEAVHDEYFADLSRLIAWLENHSFEVKAEQLNHLIHLLVISKGEA
ncbi:methyltransferase domain-containing protein [Paenibacillus sp. S-12]|uniref:MerR family transcriptional regulator n=1 Tax=Paenibacillus sp. S-12 TaxID=3031371 RepID=UPI0025A1C39C|nr:methyltransferase domain-containing protein [Paenibacillus sp. S-12]